MSAVALPELAAQIEAEHQAAIGSARSAIEHAVACGRLLLQAKATVPFGGWLEWIDHNVTVGRRQAQKYMRLAEHPDALSNAKSNALLTIDSAISTIARPQASPSASRATRSRPSQSPCPGRRVSRQAPPKGKRHRTHGIRSQPAVALALVILRRPPSSSMVRRRAGHGSIWTSWSRSSGSTSGCRASTATRSPVGCSSISSSRPTSLPNRSRTSPRFWRS
jgi:hypothetical protein